MTETARLRSGFLAGVVLLLILSGAVGYRTSALNEASVRVAQTNRALRELDGLALASTEAENYFRKQGPASEQAALALRRAGRHEGELESLVADNRVQLNNLRVVRELLRRQDAALRRGAEGLAALDRSATSSDLSAAIAHMKDEEDRLLAERTAGQEALVVYSRYALTGAGILALGLIVAAAWRMTTDFGRRTAVERALAARDQQYRQVVEQASDIIYRTDAEGRFTFCNQSALAMLHYQESEVMGRSYLRLIRQDKRREAERFYLRQFIRRRRSTYYEFPIIDGYGHERWVGQNVQLVFEAGAPGGFQAIARDITDRKRAEFELQKSRNFVERIALTTPGVLYVYDLDEQRYIFSNREITSILGYRPEDYAAFQRVLSHLVHPDELGMVLVHYESMREAKEGEIRRLEYRVRHADGRWIWLSGRETAFETRNGVVSQVVGIAQDVTARKAAQERLAYQANFDSLTGLANRHHFWTRLQVISRRAAIEQSQVSLCLFDVDHFKAINDRFGHATGDEVLEAVGNIVRGELRPQDVAGRLGGDEFCFAMPGTDCAEAARLAERVRERLCTLAFGMDSGSPFSVSATFGIAESADHMDVKQLMEAADRALYRAKAEGRNRIGIGA